MSTHKNIDRICIAAIVIAVVLSVLMMNGEALGITRNVSAMGYEKRLFDTSTVHTIDIVMDDWDSFIQTAQSEEYSECAVVIDGKAYKNVGIRGKGNTSLSSVASMDSERYSFKIEFDKYDKNKSYYGLDKLCLNNIIQDNTYMKDYLTYQLMNEFGVDAPLCSFAYITVNGEDWGLYLAVEGVEDGFLQRNYGTSHGNLYKPDSLSMGGGKGNGKEFDFSEIEDKFSEMFGDADFEEIKQQFENFMNGNNGNDNSDEQQGGFSPDNQGGMQKPDDMTFPNADNGNMFNPENSRNENSDDNSSSTGADFSDKKDGFEMPDMGNMPDMSSFGGMGSDDVKLQYIDDDFDSYSNIFESAKTDISDADKERLISSLKSLSENTDIEDVVDVEKVIRYFVVHNFVRNGDSYTGSMIHNYYLYEKDGKMSMIPWDYNLAYGTFQGGNADSEVNSPIDTPVSGDMSDRPMINWIFENEEYTELYHQYFAEFLNSVDIESIIDEAAELIAPYVEKDPTKFCTYEEFEKGVETLRTFCKLRSESVQGQLDGTIPSTTDGQSADSSSLVDASSITLSDMGTMNNGGGFGGDKGGFGDDDKGGFGGGRHNKKGGENADNSETDNNSTSDNQSALQSDTVKMTYSVSASSNAQQSDKMPTDGDIPDFANGNPPDDMPQPPDNAAGQTPPDFAKPDDSENNSASNADNSNEQTPSEGSADSGNPEQSDLPDNFAPPSMNNDKNGGEGENGSSGNNGGNNPFNGAPDSDNRQFPQNSGTQNNVNAYILLGISVVMLAGGLVFAFRFRR